MTGYPHDHDTVGIRDLRQNPTPTLERVRLGAKVTITKQGKPYVDMVPHRESDSFVTLESLQQTFIGYGRALGLNGDAWLRDIRPEDDTGSQPEDAWESIR